MNKELDILCYNLRFLKSKYGLTQEDLAKIGQVNKRSISKFLHHQIPKSTGLEFLANIAEYFGLEINQLFLLDFGK